MKKLLLALCLMTSFCAFSSTNAVAEGENACSMTHQDCVANKMTEMVHACLNPTEGPVCNKTNDTKYDFEDKFAVSAEQLALRAMQINKNKNCDTAEFKNKALCNQCYKIAKLPLQSHYDGELFHGLLGNATSIIESKRKEKCDVMTNKPKKDKTEKPKEDKA